MKNPVVTKILAIVVGIVIFIGILVIGFQLVGTRAADVEPRDVVVSNIEKNSVKISWATGVDTQAVVEYGTTPTTLNFFAPEATKGKTHTLDLTLLSPNTTYYFDIRIGDQKFDNGGVPWTFSTKNTEGSVASPTATIAPIDPAAGSTSPTPVQSLSIPDGSNGCSYTDCAVIKTNLGKGCSTQDYFLCLRKLTPTP
ncbi:MAG: putative secreted protein containing fibronectin type III-like protein [Candidatus Roizmanbacteria bacterium GW2011_GWA2_35_8]|uniref:Putative secreted protein containing fibronectin type III-like protein n=1 Tax=Candidatus Roizmanbacteria bacterium GW2011_GWA2_35_8 TaxID=1618479 RepID=A0A0G0FEQ6_9BACT|nr:MAG: putative secreted protein containing fibronectin type III-like protein [Candidatus Roizmanbacteria bacterium GW2011_GWA2_35_8]